MCNARLRFRINLHKPDAPGSGKARHIGKESVGLGAETVNVVLHILKLGGQYALGPPLVDEAGEHVNNRGRKIAVGGPLEPDIILLLRLVRVPDKIRGVFLHTPAAFIQVKGQPPALV